ncbi:hypothetical protein [Actinophytocola glycyrrhizae]|uniref:Uncharacterized protein n=1 Tax=Actinophytocola glycyrrhizae TaxID=2044873 RepID=A0ABV9S0E5_9PSEU
MSWARRVATVRTRVESWRRVPEGTSADSGGRGSTRATTSAGMSIQWSVRSTVSRPGTSHVNTAGPP